MKKTKIVATIGPATASEDTLEALFRAGADVVRLNFSHGSYDDHRGYIQRIRAAGQRAGARVAICLDLAGPKIRIGQFDTELVELVSGATLRLTTEQIAGSVERVSVNYPNLPREVEPGHQLFLDDGKKKLEVIGVEGNEVICRVIVGGAIRGGRGVNLPDSELSVSSLTEKDRRDVEFGLAEGVDFFALSFVRRADDIRDLRDLLAEARSSAQIIAKIETPQAIKALEAIVDAADGVMVARGDLAIEIPTAQVPLAQKRIITLANQKGKPVITATQMMESMIESPVPTRAEVSDVANAILDGTDAVMLSAETAIGKYPVETVQTMAGIASEVESHQAERMMQHARQEKLRVVDSITRSVVETAHEVGARAIVALTETGATARLISRHRPRLPILALSHHQATCNQLTLSFGCLPIHIGDYQTIEDVTRIVRDLCAQESICAKGDKVVIAAGAPFHVQGSTNMLLVEVV